MADRPLGKHLPPAQHDAPRAIGSPSASTVKIQSRGSFPFGVRNLRPPSVAPVDIPIRQTMVKWGRCYFVQHYTHPQSDHQKFPFPPLELSSSCSNLSKGEQGERGRALFWATPAIVAMSTKCKNEFGDQFWDLPHRHPTTVTSQTTM